MTENRAEDNESNEETDSNNRVTQPWNAPLSKAERKAELLKRSQQRKKQAATKKSTPSSDVKRHTSHDVDASTFVDHLSRNETELLKFVVTIQMLFTSVLFKPVPFMTWILVGMQSSGKSTFMERLLNAVVNIVQEGTGTRCPLDVTCIYDESCSIPKADLTEEELEAPGTALSEQEVFERTNKHNSGLAAKKEFSKKRVNLVYRSAKVQSGHTRNHGKSS